MENDTTELRWRAPKYEHRDKNPEWYWVVSIITIALTATAVIFNEVLIAVLIVVTVFTLTMYASRIPEKIDVVINDRGITIDSLHYPYSSLAAFYVEEMHESGEDTPRLFLRPAKNIAPQITVLINPEEVDPDDITYTLMDHLDEEEMGDTIFIQILRKLGF